MGYRIALCPLTTTYKRVIHSTPEKRVVADAIWLANTTGASINLRLYVLRPGETIGNNNAVLFDVAVRNATLFETLGASQLTLDLGESDELWARASATGVVCQVWGSIGGR